MHLPKAGIPEEAKPENPGNVIKVPYRKRKTGTGKLKENRELLDAELTRKPNETFSEPRNDDRAGKGNHESSETPDTEKVPGWMNKNKEIRLSSSDFHGVQFRDDASGRLAADPASLYTSREGVGSVLVFVFDGGLYEFLARSFRCAKR